MSTSVRGLITEAVCTCLLVFLAVGSAVLAIAAIAGVEGIWPGTVVLAAALAVGVVVLGAVTSRRAAPIGPNVTLALLRRRLVSPEAAMDSWIGQAIGALLAGLGLYLFIPWVTEVDADAAEALGLMDVLIAVLLSVLLLAAAPLLGAGIAALFGRPAVGTPAMGDADPIPEPKPSPLPVPVPDPVPIPEPVTIPDPVPIPEPVTIPDPVPIPEPIPDRIRDPVSAGMARAHASNGPVPHAQSTQTRVQPSATRVAAPFPAAPAPSPYPLRRAIEPRPPMPPKPAIEPSEPLKSKEKKTKKGHGRKGKGHKSKSSVTVQVKVTDRKKDNAKKKRKK